MPQSTAHQQMVAARITTNRPPEHPAHEEDAAFPSSLPDNQDGPEDYARYTMPVDQTAARVNPTTKEVEVYDYHECFKERSTLSETEAREFAIKQAAVRIVCGLELRSLRTLAKHIGCFPSAIDNCVLRICKSVNMRKFHVKDSTRQKQREARLRNVAAMR